MIVSPSLPRMRFRWCLATLCVLAGHSAAQAAPLTPPDEASAERTESMCKITAQEQGLEGKAADNSVQGCVAEQSPDLAYWEHCRQEARQQHLTGEKLSGSVTYCMSRRQ